MKRLSIAVLIFVILLSICAYGENSAPRTVLCTGDEIVPADDTELTLLVDYCERTVATVGGDGYSEIVLYKNDSDGSYEVHTYSFYEYMEEEEHRACAANRATADRVFALIKELKPEEYEKARRFGPEGMEYAVRFLKDGRLIRVSTDNMGADGANKLSSVGMLLYGVLYA